jgi:RNA polymerase sigma-70 factor, ECF subfamily
MSNHKADVACVGEGGGMADVGVVAAPRGLVTTVTSARVVLLAAGTVSNPPMDLRMAATDMDFADFYAATFNGLCLQLFVYTGDLATAQDVVQEAFCRALPRWSTLSEYDDPAAWVRKVAWNLATSRWRQLRKFAGPINLREEAVAAPDVERVDLMNALATLPARQRQAVVLHYLADASIAEIAVITGTSEGTIKSWLHRARIALAGQLGVGYGTPSPARIDRSKRKGARDA